MKVLMIATQEVVECNASYGARLIEQGKAVIQPDEENAQEATPCEAAEQAAETDTGKRSKKR